MRILPINNVSPTRRYLRAFILGIGCFFPGLLFSLPFTMLWVDYKWPGNRHSAVGAVGVSLLIGVLSVPFGWIVLFWKAARKPAP